MHNKFLEKYPKLWIPTTGDQIRIIQILGSLKQPVTTWHYNVGDTGIIQGTGLSDIADEYVYNVYFDMYNREFPVYREEFDLIRSNNEKQIPREIS